MFVQTRSLSIFFPSQFPVDQVDGRPHGRHATESYLSRHPRCVCVCVEIEGCPYRRVKLDLDLVLCMLVSSEWLPIFQRGWCTQRSPLRRPSTTDLMQHDMFAAMSDGGRQ